MNGDIAHRSIRSSMSRIVEARLPRMISSVTGSTVADERTRSGMGALQEKIVRAVDARLEGGRDQARRVGLVDDRRTGERHARRETFPRIHGDGSRAAATEVDGALTNDGTAGVCPIGGVCGRQRPLRQLADGGDAEVDQLHLGAREVVAVEPAMLGVERGDQLLETARGQWSI